ncbi:hypothetical protein BKD03_10870 [Brucella sp. 09RB8471]|nr:hypothetical protein BKD03_10870 [Brucella sp. 09RB8471]
MRADDRKCSRIVDGLCGQSLVLCPPKAGLAPEAALQGRNCGFFIGLRGRIHVDARPKLLYKPAHG